MFSIPFVGLSPWRNVPVIVGLGRLTCTRVIIVLSLGVIYLLDLVQFMSLERFGWVSFIKVKLVDYIVIQNKTTTLHVPI
jgi:hypothetical protein